MSRMKNNTEETSLHLGMTEKITDYRFENINETKFHKNKTKYQNVHIERSYTLRNSSKEPSYSKDNHKKSANLDGIEVYVKFKIPRANIY